MAIATRIDRRGSLLGILALVGIVAGVWLSQQPARAQGDVHVLVQGPGRHTFLDFEQPGLKLGDRLAARGALFDAAGTTQVGRMYLDCVIMNKLTDDPIGGMYWCTYLLRLPNGDVTIEGLDPRGPGVYTFAVVGGTGVYADAGGEATLTDGSEGTEIVLHLIG